MTDAQGGITAKPAMSRSAGFEAIFLRRGRFWTIAKVA